MSFTLVVLSGVFHGPDGQPATGHVTFQLSHELSDGSGTILSRAPKVATLDGTGAFSISLEATDDPSTSPPGQTYQVTEQIGGAPSRTYQIVLPSANPTCSLAALAPARPLAASAQYVLSSVFATAFAATERTANKGQPSGYASLDSGAKIPLGQIPALPETDVTNLVADLAAEVTNRSAAVSAEASTRTAADSAEALARAAADTTNANAIATETSNRAAAVTAEASARAAADTSEANTRATADTANANAISAETSRAEVAEALLVPLTDARLSDQRTPLDGSVTDAKVNASAGIAATKINFAFNINILTQKVRASATASTALQAAIDACQSSGSGAVELGPGTHVLDSATLLIARNLGLRVCGQGPDLTTVLCTASAPRMFDPNRVADHDLFKNVTLAGFTLDAASIAAGSQHVLVGNVTGAGAQMRNCYDNWRLEDIDIINVPYDATGAAQRSGIRLEARQQSTGEGTQDYITRIGIRRVRINPGTKANPYGAANAGPNRGIYIDALLNDATTNAANVLIDRVLVEDCEHNTGHSPLAGSVSTDSCLQIGSLASGGHYEVVRFRGSGSNDVGAELDGATTTLVDSCVFTDCKNTALLFYNFQPPATPAASKHVVRDLRVRVINAVATATHRSAVMVGDSNMAVANTLKDVEIKGVDYYSAQTDALRPGQLLDWKGPCSQVALEDAHLVLDSINETLAANVVGSVANIAPPGTSKFKPRNVTAELSGTVTLNGHTCVVRGYDIEPADASPAADFTSAGSYPALDFTSSLAGIAAGQTVLVQLGQGTTPTNVPTYRGILPGMRYKVSGGDTDPIGINTSASTILKPDGKPSFDWLDAGGCPTGGTLPTSNNFGHMIVCGDATWQQQVVARGIRMPFPSGSGGGTGRLNWASRTLTAAAGAHDFQNVWPIPVVVVLTNISAAGITDVAYKNVPQQDASGDPATVQGMYLLGPGDKLTVTQSNAVGAILFFTAMHW